MAKNLKFPSLIKKRITRKPISREQKYCHHQNLQIDEASRLLQCELCGMSITPFDFIRKIAVRHEVIEHRISQLEDDERELYKRIVELKKEEKRIKARIRCAKKKMGLFEAK